MSTLSERLHRGAASAPSQVDHARRLVAAWQLLAAPALGALNTAGPPRTGARAPQARARGAAPPPSQVDHARRLVADWQLLADLAFADLTLWVPLRTGAWWCVAQVRPLTAPTSQPEDLVGSEMDGPAADPLRLAHREGRPVTEGEPDWSGSTPRRREVVPVRHDGVVVAVLAKDTNLAVTRSPSTLELTYLDIAADLCLMVSAGTFPPEKLLDAEMSPRVGDGLVRLDATGLAVYASPNALSAYRRLGVTGDLVGADLGGLAWSAGGGRGAGGGG